jgi:hypothetical protein
MITNYKHLLLFSLMSFSITCAPHHSQDRVHEIPPSDLLISNYQMADQVCVISVIDIIAQDTLFTDGGDPGYIRYLFKTEVNKILKGKLESESILTFYSSVEYNENFIPFWRDQKKLLVFLKENIDSHKLYAIEAGIIPYSDKLEETIKAFHRVHEGDTENTKEL